MHAPLILAVGASAHAICMHRGREHVVHVVPYTTLKLIMEFERTRTLKSDDRQKQCALVLKYPSKNILNLILQYSWPPALVPFLPLLCRDLLEDDVFTGVGGVVGEAEFGAVQGRKVHGHNLGYRDEFA